MPRKKKDAAEANAESTQSSVCPPHHWTVTNVRIDNVGYYHHHCQRCDAQKDIPIIDYTTGKAWKLNSTIKKPAAVIDEK